MALRIVGVVIDIRAVIYKNPYGFDLPVRYSYQQSMVRRSTGL